MKTKLLLLAILLTSFVNSQTTLTIGTGTSSSATRGPFQRSDSGSSSVYSRAVLHYSATELASLSPSATISQINFDLGSTNIITASGDATMTIYMKNSTASEVVALDSSWDDAIDGATIVGSYTFNTTNNFPGVEGFLSFILSTGFNYTGGALEVAVDWDCSNLTPADAGQPNLLFSDNGSLNWHWTATSHTSLNYRAGSSSAPTTLNQRKAERVNTQIVYTGSTTAPTTGQVIGEFPIMDGGMESQTADDTMSSAGSGQSGTPQTIWTVSSTGNSEVRDMTENASLARTGDFSAAFQIASGNSNLRLQSPSTVSPNQLQINTEYTIQFFYKSSSDPGSDLDPGIYLNNTSGSNTTDKIDVTPFAANTWMKTYGTVTTGVDINASHWAVARMSGSNLTEVRVDDFVVYSGPYDDEAPNEPMAGTYDNTAGTATIGWSMPTDGVDGGGYVVIKYATMPNADNDPSQNGIYEYGNTTTNGTGGLVGTVIYIGTDTSFTDVYTAGNYYKIYAVDKAFNYSDEIVVSDETLGLVDNDKVVNFKLFPNPASNFIIIESNEAEVSSISIYDITGKNVQVIKEIKNKTIDVSGLNKGVYFIKINVNGNYITKKVIIE